MTSARTSTDPRVFRVERAVARVDGEAVRAVARVDGEAVRAVARVDGETNGLATKQANGLAVGIGITKIPPVKAPPVDLVDSADEHSPNYRWVLLGVIGMAVLGFGSLMTLVNAALVPIADDLNTTVPTAGWVMTGLMLAMAVSTPAGGKLADIYGHRRIFLLGLTGMTVTMVLNYWVWNIASFIGLRVLFGICGGLLMPSGMALLMHAFGAGQRARAVGWFQFAMTGAPTIGVVVGGPLLNVFGWREIFLAFGAVSTAATLFGLVIVKPIPRGKRVPIDLLGALLLASSTLSVLFAITRVTTITRSGNSVFTDRPIALLVVASVVSLLLFIRRENRAPSPLLDLSLFRRATFSLPLVSAACNQFAYMGAFVIVPWVLQGPYGYAVGTAALLMAPRPGVFAISSPLGGALVTKVGPRLPMFIGSTAMVVSMIAFAAGSDPSSLALGLVMVGLMLSGVSAGLGSPAYQTMVANSVDDKDLGVANGMNQTVMWIGIVLGIQTMLAFAGDDPSLGRVRSTFMIGAAVAAFGYMAPLFATTRRRSKVPQASS